MKKNMGATDKIIRLLAAIVILALYVTKMVSGTMGLVLLAVAAIFALTSIAGTCLLYLPFGISTKKG